MLTVSVLGAVELCRDGERVAVRAGKTAEVLIRLALDAGVMVRTERLIEDLWGNEAVDTARNTLQTKVSRLRRALGDAATVTGGRSGYTLEIHPAAVDALEVLRLVDMAKEQLRVGDARAALDASVAGLAMFRGEILCDAGDGEWLIPHRVRLEEARLQLIEDQLAARMELGAAGEVVGDLEALVSAHPLRERIWVLLLTALYRDGRQADALAAYQRVRDELAEGLGLEPGPELQALERRILIHDESLSVPHQTVRLPGHDVPAGNLPSMSAELVGRDPELAALCELLDGGRLVEVVGPGGIGKTALAVSVGRRLRSSSNPGGCEVWLARLETAVTPTDVVDTLIAAFNVSGEAALFERLKATAALVILDNCEHIVDAAADLTVRLLDAAPGLRILCTSQVPLDIDGEVVFELAPLALSDAVELFTRRSSKRSRNSMAGDDDNALYELCRSLDGLPLAIELAAARTKTLSIEEITRRLDDRFAVLINPTSRKPERRRALKATIGWSYELLFPDDQRGLWALATFAGGASLPAVESVVDALDVPAAGAIDIVGRLATRSLVIVDDDGSGMVRYRLLDSIRAFALDAMAEAGMSVRALAAHAAWLADAADTSTQGVRSSRQAEHLAFARTERANIDAALAWSTSHDPLLALRLVNGFGWAWVVLGDSRGAERILTALEAAGDFAPSHRDRANALLLAAWIEASTGRLDPARDHIATATAMADAINDIDLQARSCYYLAYVVSHHGEFGQAMELTDRSDALYTGLDRPWDQAANWLFAARAAISAGNEERGVEAVDCVTRWLIAVDDPWLHVRGEAVLGELARLQRRFDDAVVHIGRAAATSKQLGFQQTEAYQVSSLGRAQCQAGRYEEGAATLEQAIEKAEATGDVRLAALARVHLGRVLRALGEDQRARTALEAATAWHRAAGGGEQAALGECLLAALDAADGTSGAEDRLVAILDDVRRGNEAHVEVFALDALARMATEAGDMARAGELAEAADRRMEAAAHFITEFDRTDAHSIRRIARA